MLKATRHVVIIALLTVVTQIGGVAWLGSLLFRKFKLLVFVGLYALGTVGAHKVYGILAG